MTYIWDRRAAGHLRLVTVLAVVDVTVQPVGATAVGKPSL